jgi:hypothetical protein
MGSKPKAPPPPPPPPAVPTTADAYNAGDAAMVEARKRSSAAKTFLASSATSVAAPQAGTSFLG